MKKFIVLALLIVFSAQAYGATLCWDYGADTIDGFRVYSINARDYGVLEPQVATIADPTARSYPLPSGAYIEGESYVFWATAYLGDLESPKSETLEWTVPITIPDEIPAPFNLRMVE